MSFVNETISPEDAIKYHLAQIDAKFRWSSASRDWTIDRERNIYLRGVGRDKDEEFRHQTYWTFFWKGQELTLRLDLLDAWGKPGGPGGCHWRLAYLNGSNGLPAALKVHRQAVVDDLQEALVAYKDDGVFSVKTDYAVTLDFSDECVL